MISQKAVGIQKTEDDDDDDDDEYQHVVYSQIFFPSAKTLEPLAPCQLTSAI